MTELRKSAKLKEKTGLIEAYTANKQYCMCVHAKPLPQEVLDCLDKHFELLKIIHRVSSEPSFEDRRAAASQLTAEKIEEIRNLHGELDTHFAGSGIKEWRQAVDRIWAIGPKGSFTNILLNNIPGYNRSNVWYGLLGDKDVSSTEYVVREYDNSLVSGFHLATQAGPMCEEPMRGVAFLKTDWKLVGKLFLMFFERFYVLKTYLGHHLYVTDVLETSSKYNLLTLVAFFLVTDQLESSR